MIATIRNSPCGPLNLSKKLRTSISALRWRHQGEVVTVKPHSPLQKQSLPLPAHLPAAKAIFVSPRRQTVSPVRHSFRLLIIRARTHSASAWNPPACCRKRLNNPETSRRQRRGSRRSWSLSLAQSKSWRYELLATNIVSTWELMSHQLHQRKRASARLS